MPGAFAHFTIVNTLVNADELDRLPNLSRHMKLALTTHSRFCDLGAVGPDYPYLDLPSGNSKGWANVMHYWQTADFVRRGVHHLSAMTFAGDETESKSKCIAWLFGFTAHLVTDLTVHPVVQAKVGPYQQNARRHRICEMHQDVYIADKLLNLRITTDEYSEIIRHCSDPESRMKLDAAVAALWTNIFGDIPIGDIRLADGIDAPTHCPDPHKWHCCFTNLIDAAENGAAPFISRVTEGTFYPSFEQLNRDYIDNLYDPTGTAIRYDEVFDRAQNAVRNAWNELGAAIGTRNPDLFTLANGDLDTGLADDAIHDAPIFWRA